MEQNKKNNSVPLGDEIVKVLKSIFDPEIPVDIYELGLICPVAESLPQEVKEKVSSINLVNEVEIEMTFEPPWSKDLMSEEAKLELGLL